MYASGSNPVPFMSNGLEGTEGFLPEPPAAASVMVELDEEAVGEGCWMRPPTSGNRRACSILLCCSIRKSS